MKNGVAVLYRLFSKETSTVGNYYPFNYHASVLEHAFALPWTGMECFRIRRSFGVADTTVRNYLDLLSSALVVRQLLPWHENISKRQVKSPKIYIADSGLLHTLLGIKTRSDLERHPKIGASWEGFIIEQVIHRMGFRKEGVFWADPCRRRTGTFSLPGKGQAGL